MTLVSELSPWVWPAAASSQSPKQSAMGPPWMASWPYGSLRPWGRQLGFAWVGEPMCR